jgi:hypothetical protein
MVMNKILRRQVEEMKKVGNALLPYTYPIVSFEEEQEILLLKQRVIKINGYYVIVCYSKADYDDHILETLQIQPIYSPFLPFSLVCKVGKMFLGSRYLSYVEFFKGIRKIYCWTIKREDGIAVPPPKSTPGNYEGFKYRILSPGSAELH